MDRYLSRRRILKVSVAGAGVFVAGPFFTGWASAAPPPLSKKDKYRVGFAQTDQANPWRIAETKSMRDEAAKRGHQLIESDANADTAKQLSDLDTIIAQKPDVIIFPPRESKPLAPAILKAKAAGIPVILVDRDVDHAVAKPGEDYVTFIGSDFVDQGRRAAEWLIKATNGTAKIIELEGSTGADPAIDRKKGFDDLIVSGSFKGTPVGDPQSGMTLLASQTGNFTRDEGRQAMETLLSAHSDVTAVYAHNDEMAIGAIAALQDAGRKPGQDVLVVSIDGENAALDAIVAGTLGATVESSPFFGPISFDTLDKYVAGETLPEWIKVEDRFFDASNAKENQGKQY
jgi:ABC-type sugar transport system substrate-binding protein